MFLFSNSPVCYGEVGSTMGSQAVNFTKNSRQTKLTMIKSDNENDNFYNPDKPSKVKNFKALGSGPKRFAEDVS